MRYIADFIKGILLVVLIATSIYQTGKLWFEETSDRNFFYDILARKTERVQVISTDGRFIKADQVGVYVGTDDVQYTVIGSGATAYRSIEDALLKSIATILNSGTYVGPIKDADMDLKEHLVLTTPFAYEGEELKKGLGVTTSEMDAIASTRAFFLVPALKEGSAVSLYVESDSSDDVHFFQINSQALTIENEMLTYYMQRIIEANNNSAYISTTDYDLSYFDRTVLLPVQNKEIRYHKEVFWRIPYVQQGQIDYEGVRAVATPFYANAAAVGQVDYDDSVRFRSGDITLRYSNKGLLTYEQVVEAPTSATTLNEALTVAENFGKTTLSKVLSEYYLAGYTMDDATVTLYYNMGYNGFPIVMDDEQQLVPEVRYPLEVTIMNGMVAKVNILLRDVEELLPQVEVFNTPYKEALDWLIETNGPLTTAVDKMYLGYRWHSDSEGMKLNWIMEVGGRKYFMEVGGR